jgi:hypothetical protein
VLAAPAVVWSASMTKIKEIAGACLLAACAAALGALFIVRESWRLLRPGARRKAEAAREKSQVGIDRLAAPPVARFTEQFH